MMAFCLFPELDSVRKAARHLAWQSLLAALEIQ